MNAGIAAYVILTQNTDVTDIVGVNIFPEVAEQETATPFIVYQLQSVAPEDTHDGPSKLDEVRFEFLCYADTYALAADLGDKVRGALDRVSGTYNGVNVESVQFNDVDIDTIDAPRRFAQVLTFTFRIKRDDFTIAQGTPVTGAKIGDLYDVDVTGVTDGQVLAYDASVQEWQPADDAGGVTELGQLTDVVFGQGGPQTGELLKYDGSEWTNDSLVKSEVGLGNVDNTSDADKPVSTATQTALSAKANSADFSNVDNTSDANKPVSTATQTALDAKANTSAVPTDLNDLSDVTIVGTPAANQALIYDTTANAFKSQVSYTNRFEDEVETGKQGITGTERAYSVKSEGDGVFLDAESDTPAAGKIIKRKIYHKTGFISDADVIGDYTLIHTFADNTAYADTVAVFDGFEDGATYGVPPFTLLQTWEEVNPSILLLDTYTNAEFAFSIRKLRTAYTGPCMRVRRSSNNDELDVYFDGNGDLDTTTLLAFTGTGDGFVRTFYDQSGNSIDAEKTATSSQPQIVNGGVVNVDANNGKPIIVDREQQEMFSLSPSGYTNSTFIHVSRGSGLYQDVYMRRPGTNAEYIIPSSGATSPASNQCGSVTYYANGIDQGALTRGGAYTLYNGTNALMMFSELDTTNLFGGSTVYFGRAASNRGGLDMQESVLWPTSQTSPTNNRIAIQNNVNDYFEIY